MVKIKIGDEIVQTRIRFRVRMDYKGVGKSGRLFFSSKNIEKLAEETRDHQVALLRNVPVQGVHIEDIEMSGEVYTIFDEELNAEVAYAPAIFIMNCDSLEDIIRFLAREEFRKIEIIEPENLYLSNHDVERLFFKIGDEMKNYRTYIEKRLNSR
jgi:hypothetical protein